MCVWRILFHTTREIAFSSAAHSMEGAKLMGVCLYIYIYMMVCTHVMRGGGGRTKDLYAEQHEKPIGQCAGGDFPGASWYASLVKQSFRSTRLMHLLASWAPIVFPPSLSLSWMSNRAFTPSSHSLPPRTLHRYIARALFRLNRIVVHVLCIDIWVFL